MSDNVFDLANEDAENPVTNSDEAKASVARLARLQVELENEVDKLEGQLKSKKIELQRVAEQDLPEAMDKIGMKKFELTDGTKIDISTFYNASIPAERKPEAFAWLDENGHGGLIKTEVEVKFERGELEIAKEFMTFIRGFNQLSNEPELLQNVHFQTLRGFVREQVESGATLPQDLFGVFIGRKAKIKTPKHVGA